MPYRLLDLVPRVQSLFSQIDQGIVEFQLKTGLRCIAGCGQCCAEADVFTTVLEMLPVAHEILCRGKADYWLSRINEQIPNNLCVFYRAEIAAEDPGHCTSYLLRPSICRLFGYAAVRSRRGSKILGVCKAVKPFNSEAATRAVELQDEALSFPEIGSQVYAQDPVLGSRLLPINHALREALMCLGLQMQIAQSENLGNTTAA